MNNNNHQIKITCVILAGGRGTRMNGQDKGLIPYQGKALIEHVINAVSPQSDEIIINANRNLEIYQQYGYQVISDADNHYLGPLSGMLAGLHAAKHEHIVFVPCDTPLLPNNLITKLLFGASNTTNQASVAFDGDRIQSVITLLHKKNQKQLTAFLAKGNRKVMEWLSEIKAGEVDFSNQKNYFKNINTKDDLTVI